LTLYHIDFARGLANLNSKDNHHFPVKMGNFVIKKVVR